MKKNRPKNKKPALHRYIPPKPKPDREGKLEKATDILINLRKVMERPEVLHLPWEINPVVVVHNDAYYEIRGKDGYLIGTFESGDERLIRVTYVVTAANTFPGLIRASVYGIIIISRILQIAQKALNYVSSANELLKLATNEVAAKLFAQRNGIIQHVQDTQLIIDEMITNVIDVDNAVAHIAQIRQETEHEPGSEPETGTEPEPAATESAG